MYGLILNCIKWTVLTKYGESVWKEILLLANIQNADWNDDQSYEENILYALASATTKTLNVSLNVVLELVGRGFIDYIAGSEYQKMIFIGGHTFMDLLQNVTTLHLHMRMGHFKEMRPPVFKVVTYSPTHVGILHKYGMSTRHSWGSIIVGLLKEAVDRYYRTVKNLTIKIEKSDVDGHNELTVKWEEDELESEEEKTDAKFEYALPPNLFGNAFPFHFVINTSLEIVQLGQSLSKIFYNVNMINEKASTRFAITRPSTLNWKNFRNLSRKYGNEAIVLTTISRKGCTKQPIDFVGQFLYKKSKKLSFFVGSPHFRSIEHATQWGISLKDFAVFDASKDGLFIKDARSMRTNLRFSSTSSSLLESSFSGTESEGSSTPTKEMSKRNSTYNSNMVPETKIIENKFDNATSIAEVVNYIVKERLNLDEDCSNWINMLSKNLIHTLGLLKRLPGPEPLQRIGLPILLETELTKFLSYNNLSYNNEVSTLRIKPKEREKLGALLGLSNSTKQLLKSQWNEILSTKGSSNSLLTKFGDKFFTTVSKMDALCKRLYSGSYIDQANTLMNIMQLIIVALDNPVRLMSLVKQQSVQYMIYGADNKTFQSIGMAISTAFEHTLGTEKVKPNDKESWIVLTRAVGKLIVEEYKEVTEGRVGKLYMKKTDKKWKRFFTKLTASKLILYRDNTFKDKKEEIDLAIGLEVERVDTDVIADYETNFCFSIEGLGTSKNASSILCCVDSEESLENWLDELSIRIRALEKMSS